MARPDPDPSTGPLTPDLAGLRRLERRIARTMNARAVGRRIWESLPAIAQLVVAVLGSYAIAHYALGHATPVLAVTVAITSLGFTRDARPSRVAKSVLGILLGVAVATALTYLVGQGVWQFALLLLAVLLVARLLVPDPTFAIVAVTPAALTFLLPIPDGGPWVRALDGLIGGAVALLATILIPRDPRRADARERRAVYSVLVQATENIADCLRFAEEAPGELGLTRLRRLDGMLADWRISHDTAKSVARISPFLRRRLPEIERGGRALQSADFAVRHLRLVARRAAYAARDGVRRETVAGLVSRTGQAIGLLSAELDDLGLVGSARGMLLDLAERLRPAPDADAVESALVAQLRPLAVDLLVGTGLPLEEARARLAPLD